MQLIGLHSLTEESAATSGLFQELSEYLHSSLASQLCSEATKELLIKSISESYGLFYAASDTKLGCLECILTENSTSAQLAEVLLSKFNSPLQLSLLLNSASQERIESFQSLLLSYKGSERVQGLLQNYLLALYSHVSRRSQEYLTSLFETAAFDIMNYALSHCMGLTDLQQRTSALETVRILLWALPIIELERTFLYKLLPVVSELHRALVHIEVPEPSSEVASETVLFESEHPCPVGTYNFSLPTIKDAISVKLSISENTQNTVKVFDRGLEVLTMSSGEFLFECPRDFSLTVTVEEENWGHCVELVKTTRCTDTTTVQLNEIKQLVLATYLRVCEILIERDTSESPLNSLLVAGGIADEAWGLVGCSRTVPEELQVLAALSVEDEEVPLTRSVSVGHLIVPASDLKSLKDFFTQLTSKPSYKYDRNVLIERLIDNKGLSQSFWLSLTAECALDKSVHNMTGGAGAEKAERAVLAVLLKLSRTSAELESLFSTVRGFPEDIKVLRKKAHEIRN